MKLAPYLNQHLAPPLGWAGFDTCDTELQNTTTIECSILLFVKFFLCREDFCRYQGLLSSVFLRVLCGLLLIFL